ncbi:synaptogyrin-2b [Paramormyrops kingsleyae]|uniref:Synaptogyrin n=1 Tax=Paramormyrops kingsleyae TaxID=1676925 RepID=A0A3B3SGT7_9TELE|nr:synaptogyrin-2-like [Paramormyrops kingsleyae]
MEAPSGSAYGASLAGGSFDPISFIQRPQTVLRVLSWVFAIVVFGSITAEGYINPSIHVQEVKCMFNQNDSACRYGVAVGVLAFLACMAFLVLDALLPHISNAIQRKYIVIGDLIFSGIWSFLWFVCFCLLANQWSHTQNAELIPGDAARATIAFAFFSIGTWGGLAFVAFKMYSKGVENFVENPADPANNHATPYPPAYPTYPSGGGENYQQPQFATMPPPQEEGGYQPPVY